MFTCELSFIRRLAFAELRSKLGPGRVLISLSPLPNFSHLTFPHVITLLDNNAMLNPNPVNQYFNWLRSVRIVYLKRSIFVWVEIVLMLFTVTMKFIAPSKDETPARCKLKMAKSTAGPECDCILDNGG